ncbi:MAG: hypothetical protein Q4C53_07320 [Clostridia bacterium]|nr:hypothetical protein [Clostridia bacterium]
MTMDTKQIIENLEDAGCDTALTEQFEALWTKGDQKGQMRLLTGYRRLLLDEIHAGQKKLDCLDYLICRMKAQQANGG